MSDRIKIYIEETGQETVATMRLENPAVGLLSNLFCVLDNIFMLKPFPLFSKVKFLGVEEEFYCAGNKLVSRNTKPLEDWIKKPNKESEDKPMQHNVTITKEENRVIEEYYVMRAIKENVIIKGMTKQVFKEKELDHNPTLREIAQFLSETKTNFVSVEHNYRFADLPFC